MFLAINLLIRQLESLFYQNKSKTSRSNHNK